MRDPIREQPPLEPVDTPPRRGPLGPRRWTRWQDWATLILGAWFFVAPWVLGTAGRGTGRGYGTYGYAGTNGVAAWNNWWTGAAIFVVSLWALSVIFANWAEWINAALGIWLFISPWVLGFAGVPRAAWDAWLVGAAVFILAAWVIALVNGWGIASSRWPRGPRGGMP